MSRQTIKTPFTEHFGLTGGPISLAGMSQAAGPELAAAVCNAGCLGVIGGVRLTPKQLRKNLSELKECLNDKNAPFGVDLLLPKVGGSARATNKSYVKDQLPELIDIIIESGAKLFVSAVGVPPAWVVKRLHEAGILVSGIVGHAKHVKPVLAAGADMIIFQAGEGGGHTGDIPFTILAPGVVELCRGHKSPMTGKQVMTLAAGGIFNGQGLAAALSYGADGVWVGTRFVCSAESGASKKHKEAVLSSDYTTDVRTVIFTGRPLRVRRSAYIDDWESKPELIKELTSKGIIPHDWAQEQNPDDDELGAREWPHLMGKAAALLRDIKPAKDIIDDMTREAAEIMTNNAKYIVPSRL